MGGFTPYQLVASVKRASHSANDFFLWDD